MSNPRSRAFFLARYDTVSIGRVSLDLGGRGLSWEDDEEEDEESEEACGDDKEYDAENDVRFLRLFEKYAPPSDGIGIGCPLVKLPPLAVDDVDLEGVEVETKLDGPDDSTPDLPVFIRMSPSW